MYDVIKFRVAITEKKVPGTVIAILHVPGLEGQRCIIC